LDTANIFHVIDSVAVYVKDGAGRHFSQFSFTYHFQPQVDSMKTWIGNRIAWMDANMFGHCWNTGVADLNSIENTISVFPNPFNTNFNVKFYLNKKENLNVSLYDVFGRKIKELVQKEFDLGNNTIPIELSGYAPGVYFLRIESGASYAKTVKLIKN